MAEFETGELVKYVIQIVAVITMIALVIFFITNILGG